jgi:hypothetical protein
LNIINTKNIAITGLKNEDTSKAGTNEIILINVHWLNLAVIISDIGTAIIT